MEIELVRVDADNWPVLENLGQLYAYDFSEILGVDTDPSGRFRAIDFGRASDPSNTAFIVKAGGNLAGFALVHQGSTLSDDHDVIDMNEFFVMRKYRRHGVGRELAVRMFDMFPGRWEVREVAPNLGAQAFWRRVIRDYTGGAFEEHLIENESWNGPVQTFISGGEKR